MVIKPDPGNIVKTAILPGFSESLDFKRNGSRQYRMFVKKPDPGNIVKMAILPGIDEMLDFI